MNDTYTPVHLAEGAIKRGMVRLAQKYPYHTRVLERFRVAALPAVGTMGVTVRGGQLLLLHNPDFVLSLPSDELGGVLLHEVHHVVLGHLTLNLAAYEDRWALTVAMEVSVNEFIAEPLPQGAVLLEQFPTLPPMESTPQRYNRLERVQDRTPFHVPNTASGAADGDAWGELIEAALGNTSSTPEAPGGSPPASPAATLDNHEVWQEALKDRDKALEAIATVLQQAALEAAVPPELQQSLQRLGVGTAPGELTYQLRRARTGRLDWRRLLRRYVSQVLEPRPVFNWPPRRYPHLLGVFPGKRRGARSAVLAVIDTSGSIEDEHLEMIDAELRLLSRTSVIHVVECDCLIRRVTRYDHRLEVVTGRGGTDFRPPLERAFLQRFRPDLVVYFTDGDGPAPETAPSYPLIWCLVPGGEPPTPWGRIVRMDPADAG